ncbi:hypothetical protein ACSLBF_05435 [Pseudoalteromonas sp. T1lg65]|uniref:hypothetical protein n=1 Tax=Pseudoalteromonas sp. T1lg65 TaxID=2077101 RepID=UPI003F7A379D
MLITPTRVAFDDRQRIATVTLINGGEQTKTYRMTFQEKLALKEGGYSNFVEPEANVMAASSFIRMSPKQVTLAPGERQVVKLALRRRANMAAGEYRSHLLFSVLPSAQDKRVSENSGGIDINLLMNYTIPVLFRVGQAEAKVALEKVDFVERADGMQSLAIRLNRQGKYSSFGQLEALWQPDGQTSQRLVSALSKFSIYPELNQREVNLDIDKTKQITPPGKLTLKYIGDGEYQGHTFFTETIQLSR